MSACKKRVPEQWEKPGNGERIVVMSLDDRRTYQSVERSRFFAGLDVAEFSQFVLRAIADQRTGVREFRKLIRSQKGQSNP